MNSSVKKIILVGSGAFASEIIQYLADIIEHKKRINSDNKLELFGIVDNFANDKNIKELDGINFLGCEDDIKNSDDFYFLIASGTPAYRKDAFLRLKKQNKKLFTLVHPSAYISKNCTIGYGSIICPNSIINSKANVGIGSLINVFSSIGHHSLIGNFSVLSPYCSISGNAEIGEASFLGTRATLFPNIKIGKCCTIDSHTYVKSNVKSYHIVSLRSEYLLIKNRLLQNR